MRKRSYKCSKLNHYLHGAFKRACLSLPPYFITFLKFRRSGVLIKLLKAMLLSYSQIRCCQELSDKLSKSIKRLDLMHTNASNTLSYVENIINLVEARRDIAVAIKDGDLNKAVNILKQVHDVKSLDSQPTEDYLAIQDAEVEVRLLVKKEFANAIESSNVDTVMSLCPLLQSLGLETEARDDFIAFMERTVFSTISADLIPSSAEGDSSADLATTYAHALSVVFNTSYTRRRRRLMPMGRMLRLANSGRVIVFHLRSRFFAIACSM